MVDLEPYDYKKEFKFILVDIVSNFESYRLHNTHEHYKVAYLRSIDYLKSEYPIQFVLNGLEIGMKSQEISDLLENPENEIQDLKEKYVSRLVQYTERPVSRLNNINKESSRVYVVPAGMATK